MENLSLVSFDVHSFNEESDQKQLMAQGSKGIYILSGSKLLQMSQQVHFSLQDLIFL
jgi:hypothetical protein